VPKAPQSVSSHVAATEAVEAVLEAALTVPPPSSATAANASIKRRVDTANSSAG
jgi:hypothetical protein